MKKLEHFKVVALNIEILGIVKIKTALAVRTRSLAFAWPSLSNLLIYVIQKIADFMYVYQRYIIIHKIVSKMELFICCSIFTRAKRRFWSPRGRE